MVAHKARKFTQVDLKNLSTVSKVEVAVGLSQHAQLSDVDKKEKNAIQEILASTTWRSMMVTPPAPKLKEISKWEMKDPSPVYDFSSNTDVAMCFIAITFASEEVEPPEGTSKGNGEESLIGNMRVLQDVLEGDSKRPVIKDRKELIELTDSQMYHEIVVIPSYYWNQEFWSCLDDDHLTFSSSFLSIAQRCNFAYRFYLFQVTAQSQIATYLQEKLQWRI